jgi:CheY-like chemotaxis protein
VFGAVPAARPNVGVTDAPGGRTRLLSGRGGKRDMSTDFAPPPTSRTQANPNLDVILAVDDDPAVRTTVVLQLERLGYAVLQADGAQAALQIIASPARIDLLFTDVVMPGGPNGKELAILARRLRPGLPVLFTSGFPGASQDDEIHFDAHDVLLSKPYRSRDLARAVREMLATRR